MAFRRDSSSMNNVGSSNEPREVKVPQRQIRRACNEQCSGHARRPGINAQSAISRQSAAQAGALTGTESRRVIDYHRLLIYRSSKALKSIRLRMHATLSWKGRDSITKRLVIEQSD